MRRLLVLATPLGVAIGIAASGLAFFSTHGDEPAEMSAGAQLALAGDTFDLGNVPADRAVERTIDFQNTGSSPLVVSIAKVRPAPDAACGCGVEGYEVRPQSVPPSGRGQLVFMLRVPEGMPDMEDVMVAQLSTNDPQRADVNISLRFRMSN